MNLICFSHLRWNFVYQRPQHLLSRCSAKFNVFIIEEPVFSSQPPHLAEASGGENIRIIVPTLPSGINEADSILQQQQLLADFFVANNIEDYVAWYYTPMALPLGNFLPTPKMIVYDCMDELSGFQNAPSAIKQNELSLLSIADLVFTGGHSLYKAKKSLHHNIHPFPSSIDKTHFSKARINQTEPEDQAKIPHPRIGFFGVIDERLKIELLKEMAEVKSNWHFVIIGPVVKIDPATLPSLPNIHYLGGKSYNELPAYLAGWDTALIPFAINDSTRFISPTKTPEYLAGGVPVVSTHIEDVISPYGEQQLVSIASTAGEFLTAIEKSLKLKEDKKWLRQVDDFLADVSWDKTWEQMSVLIDAHLNNPKPKQEKEKIYV